MFSIDDVVIFNSNPSDDYIVVATRIEPQGFIFPEDADYFIEKIDGSASMFVGETQISKV